jgi:hypothetical protein
MSTAIEIHGVYGKSHSDSGDRPDSRDRPQALADHVCLMLHEQFAIHGHNLHVEIGYMPSHLLEHLLSSFWYGRIIPQRCNQPLDITYALGGNHAKFRRMPPQSVNRLASQSLLPEGPGI